MSLQYVIDGYNVINHHLFTNHLNRKIKDSKAALLELIRMNRLCGSPKNKIVVVFDGHSESFNEITDKGDINVIFSRRETADEWIKKMVETHSSPKNIIVVSDDKDIKFFIKSIGARAMSIEEFINSKEKARQREDISLKSELTYSQMCKINQELKKIWLKP